MKEGLILDGNGNPMPVFSPGTTEVVTVSGASAASAVIHETDRTVVRIFSTVAGYLVFGASPTATNAGMRIASNQIEYLLIRAGDKIAMLADANGSLFITKHNTKL